jgi:hypothetical protein
MPTYLDSAYLLELMATGIVDLYFLFPIHQIPPKVGIPTLQIPNYLELT